MRETLLDGRKCAPEPRASRVIYPEAVAIGLIWAASMAGGIQALVRLLG